MVQRLTVTLEQDEYSALLEMAVDDIRNPSDELRQILRMEIERRKKHLKSLRDTQKSTRMEVIS